MVLDDDFGSFSTDEKDSPIPENLENNSKNLETSSMDEDNWQEEMYVWSVECESDTDGDQEASRCLTKPDNRLVSDVFLTRSSGQQSTYETPKWKYRNQVFCENSKASDVQQQECKQ